LLKIYRHAPHVLRRGKDELHIQVGRALEENDGNNCHQYPHSEKCLGVKPYLDKLVDEPGIYPHFSILLFIAKLAI